MSGCCAGWACCWRSTARQTLPRARTRFLELAENLSMQIAACDCTVLTCAPAAVAPALQLAGAGAARAICSTCRGCWEAAEQPPLLVAPWPPQRRRRCTKLSCQPSSASSLAVHARAWDAPAMGQ